MFLCNSQVTSFRTFLGGAEFWRSMFVGTCAWDVELEVNLLETLRSSEKEARKVFPSHFFIYGVTVVLGKESNQLRRSNISPSEMALEFPPDQKWALIWVETSPLPQLVPLVICWQEAFKKPEFQQNYDFMRLGYAHHCCIFFH